MSTLKKQTYKAASDYAESKACSSNEAVFIAGAEWERGRNKWINANEEKPPQEALHHDYSVDVIVTDGKRCSSGYYDYRSDYWYSAPISGYEVTHWMPLPEPPKQ